MRCARVCQPLAPARGGLRVPHTAGKARRTMSQRASMVVVRCSGEASTSRRIAGMHAMRVRVRACPFSLDSDDVHGWRAPHPPVLSDTTPHDPAVPHGSGTCATLTSDRRLSACALVYALAIPTRLPCAASQPIVTGDTPRDHASRPHGRADMASARCVSCVLIRFSVTVTLRPSMVSISQASCRSWTKTPALVLPAVSSWVKVQSGLTA